MTAVRGSITALIIAKDEAANIGPCLESLGPLAAEPVVVVDDSTRDDTAAIARSHGARVFVRPWQGFSAAKAFGLEHASGDWVLWIDADERMTPRLADEIGRTTGAEDVAAFALPRRAFFLGRWIRHCGWYPGYVPRLFRRGRARFDGKDVHEGLVVDGPVRRLQGDLLHYTDRDLAHYLDKFNTYTRLGAEQLQRNGCKFRLYQVMVKPAVFFLKMYVLKLGFLDGPEGLLLCLLSAHYVFVKYLKLWEAGLTGTE